MLFATNKPPYKSYKRFLFFSLVLFFCVLFASCTRCSAVDYDKDYFLALVALKEQKQELAKKHFSLCIKKGSPLFAQKSIQSLSSMQDVQERVQSAQDMLLSFDDKDTYTYVAKTLYQAKEYQKLINITDSLNVVKFSPETRGYRIYCLFEKQDSRWQKELFDWTVNSVYTNAHFSLYKKLLSNFPETDDNTVLYKFRAAVFIKDYNTATARLDEIKYLLKEAKIPLTPYIISDIGKTCLYGSSYFERNARFFEQLYTSFTSDYYNTQIKFFASFYAARLWNATKNKQKALQWYKIALDFAPQKDNFDNALWYYLDAFMSYDLKQTVQEVIFYADKWGTPEYFDDFFDTLCVRLLQEHLWQDFYELYLTLEGVATDKTIARFAYISGRLIEEKLVSPRTQASPQASRSAFLRASRSGFDALYYKLMAAKKLDLKDKDVLAMSFPTNNQSSTQVQAQNESFDPQIQKLIKGYITYGLHEFIYGEWQRQKQNISPTTALMAATYLQNCSKQDVSYLSKSLNIITYSVSNFKTEQTQKTLKLLFPQNFLPFVSSASLEFGVSEYLLLALIKTESFFSPNAKSSAGALGLTQLMQNTATEVSNRLKQRDYDILDANTNIRFGAFYLKDMINRLGNHKLLAVFAYNSGITRVREWIKNASKDLGGKFALSPGQLPYDLFLEILPYKETRDYGKKVTATACLYATLYYDISTKQVINEML